MPEPSVEIDLLRADASKIVDGLTYTGRLPNGELPLALQKLDKARSTAGGQVTDAVTVAAAELRGCLAGVLATQPDVDYADFVNEWIPEERRFRGHNWLRAAFTTVAIMWTIATGFYTITFDQANAVLTGLEKIDVIGIADSKARLYSLAEQHGFTDSIVNGFDIAVAGKSSGTAKPAPADGASETTAPALQQFLHEAAQFRNDYLIVASAITNAQDVESQIAAALSPKGAVCGLWNWGSSIPGEQKSETIGLNYANAGKPTVVASWLGGLQNFCKVQTPSSGYYPNIQDYEPAKLPNDKPSGPAVVGAAPPPLPGLVLPPSGQNLVVARVETFLSSLALSTQISLNDRTPGLIALLRYDVRVLGLWLLPALWGALGAAIYYLRRFLRPTYPDPTAIRIGTRMALGGLAGIVVTSVWAVQASEGRSFVTLSSFTLSFVFGYSIDIFFRLLDKLVNSLQTQIGSISPPPTTARPAEGGAKG